MIRWRQRRSLFSRPVLEGCVNGKSAFLLWPTKGRRYELHVALAPGAPVSIVGGIELGKAAARRFLKTNAISRED